MRITGLIATLALLGVADKSVSHEFWIDPTEFEVASGAAIEADLRVGEEFRGTSQAFLTSRFTRFEIHSGGQVIDVDARLGDIPAVDMRGVPDGLAVIAHETTSSRLTYNEWDRFVRFVEHKDFAGALAAHDERGLPQTGFRESYSRHVKALVSVGSGAGADRQIGMATEIVALENPYLDDMDDGLPVQVFRNGAPRSDAQVELFERSPNGDVSISLLRTDAQGIAILPVRPGHSYLADAVVLEPRDGDSNGGAVWHTYWAALTFALPAT